ncbi:DUF3800 domain-containing protein [uncultured Pseudodesulfovibrio sp.]|uniref:DUF3800 domain-containing protein n=1 Tax=uncultured Pseudodesulfovibrio sp. TaxID=2035858 RepID=UPI0029C7F12A|nr:DUF3800 domain-containing protein [uncultured Pseudodesulfovibrio sp.]
MTSYSFFIDESGDTSIEITKKGVSRWYVLVSLMVERNQEANVCNEAKIISKRCFSGAEIKSSKVGNNVKRRRRILTLISKLNIKYYAFAVDKQRIYADCGLQHKPSFYKFLNGMLFQRITTASHNPNITIDNHGRSDFMESFKKYTKKKLNLPLLSDHIFSYVDSSENYLVQLADFIAGTIARRLEGKESENLTEIVKDKQIHLHYWPPIISKYDDLSILDSTDKFNQIVQEQSVRIAENYIHKFIESLDTETQLKVQALNFLLQRFAEDPNEYIYSDTIIKHLDDVGFSGLSRQSLRSGVVAPLRDEGVVIASCSKKGYKIPYNTNDMHQFVKTVDGVVVPYIARLDAAREIMLIASGGEYDIVSSKQFPSLTNYLDSSQTIP